MTYLGHTALNGATSGSWSFTEPAGASYPCRATFFLYTESATAITHAAGIATKNTGATQGAGNEGTRGRVELWEAQLNSAPSWPITFSGGSAWRMGAVVLHSGRDTAVPAALVSGNSAASGSTSAPAVSGTATSGMDLCYFSSSFGTFGSWTPPSNPSAFTERVEQVDWTLDTLDNVSAGGTGNVQAVHTDTAAKNAILVGLASSGAPPPPDPVTEIGWGAGVSGTTSITTAAYPAGWDSDATALSEGRVKIVCAVASNHTTEANIPTVAGFSQIGTLNGGGGTQGAGTGNRRLTFFEKDAASGDDTTPTVTLTGGNVMVAAFGAYLADEGLSFETLVSAFGAETTAGLGWTQVMTTDPGLDTDDMLVLGCAVRDTCSASAEGITATGATFGSVSIRANVSSETGNDIALHVASVQVTGGPNSAAPTRTATHSTSETGVMGVLRIRAVSAGQTESGGSSASVVVAPTGAGTASEAVSSGAAAAVIVAPTGAGAASETASGGASAAVVISATGAGQEGYSGGSNAAVVVAPTGAGTAAQAEQGGSAASVVVAPTGAGAAVETASGGAAAQVVVSPTGAGSAVETNAGGTDAQVLVTPAGAGTGFEANSGGSSSTVVVSPTGGGSSEQTQSEQGGSSASVVVSPTGGGTAVEIISGGSSAPVLISPVSAGVAAETAAGGSDAQVLVIPVGAGSAVEMVASGSDATVLVLPTGGGVALGNEVPIPIRVVDAGVRMLGGTATVRPARAAGAVRAADPTGDIHAISATGTTHIAEVTGEAR